jgi:hypothetical protein
MSDDPRPRPYSILIADEELNIEEIHTLPSRADAIDRASDLMMERLALRKYSWFKIGPKDEIEEDL